MAGTFPDVPGYRFPYDKDGTQVYYYPYSNPGFVGTGPITAINSTDIKRFNQNQAGSGPVYKNNWVVFLFPEKRTITGYYLNVSPDNLGFHMIQSSTDTTNGQDGTWEINVNSYVYDDLNNNSNVSPGYRSRIQPVDIGSVIAVRIGMGYAIQALHLYGSIATTESPDRLRIVDMSGDDIAAQLDFGDIRQRNNSTKQFKVVNNSSTKTANNITVTFDVNPDASPTLIGQYQLSTDNTAYANAINIGTLAPGQSSATLYIRDTVSATAQLGPWALRITASANTWS